MEAQVKFVSVLILSGRFVEIMNPMEGRTKQEAH